MLLTHHQLSTHCIFSICFILIFCVWHTLPPPVRLEAPSEGQPCVILGVSLRVPCMSSDLSSLGLHPDRFMHTHIQILHLMEQRLICNLSLSSSAGPASVPCTDHASLEGQFPCGLLAVVFQHADHVWETAMVWRSPSLKLHRFGRQDWPTLTGNRSIY